MTNELNSSIDLEQALAHLTKEDFMEILQELDPVAWTEYNRILKGKPFSFDGRDYLLQVYRDDYPNIIIYKGRQVEMSEFSMNWLFRKLHKYPYTAGLHTFPRDKQCLRFSKQRIEPAIQDSESLDMWYQPNQSDKRMKKFVKTIKGERLQPYNFYVLGGTWETRKDNVGDAARGLTIDFIVYDERQDHPNDVETIVGEAASHSEHKHTLTLGTPKLPGSQFDMQWEASDKHFWHVSCSCGRREPITMEDIKTVEENEYEYACHRCGKELDRLNGEWLPTNPQKRPLYRGYHINQLMVPWITANEIMRKWNNPTYPKRRFHNEVLGFAYGGDDVPITIQMMYACAENDNKITHGDGDLYVGIDWGSTSYMVIQSKTANGHKLVDVAICDDSDNRKHPKIFARHLKKYPKKIKRVVCDAGPDISNFYNLKDACLDENITRHVYACYYANPPAKKLLKWNDEEMNVTAGRSEFIEMIGDEIAYKNFILPGADIDLERIQTFMDHCTNIAAERVENNAGVEFIVYKNTGPDHFLHAKVYSDVASYDGSTISIGGTAGSFEPPRESKLKSSKKSTKLLQNTRKTSSSKFPTFQMRRRR